NSFGIFSGSYLFIHVTSNARKGYQVLEKKY
ncbi:MAG: hypothetical protein ACI825_001703, partial [Planctomycetota bacterium]